MAGTDNRSTITLKGSSEIVAEFFHYGINSILYQRGIFPPETFSRVQKYGLTILISTNEELKNYLSVILERIKNWINTKCVQKLVLVISALDSGEVLEKWNFNVEYEEGNDNEKSGKEKAISDIHKEIGAIIRQITASVTFLPLLDCACSFDLHVYTNHSTLTGDDWSDAPTSFISNSEQVRLRSFSTSVHRVETSVSYKTHIIT
uniref:Mitotic spindle assembly checkpoint protein MAD2A n=1 Tax=Strigamia maritima TaxID=126957 RepID=T1IKM4_STRMM